jgi:hypothetical protein
MAKAKHAHTPSTLSLESSVYSESLTGYIAILNGALLTANAALAAPTSLADPSPSDGAPLPAA